MYDFIGHELIGIWQADPQGVIVWIFLIKLLLVYVESFLGAGHGWGVVERWGGRPGGYSDWQRMGRWDPLSDILSDAQ